MLKLSRLPQPLTTRRTAQGPAGTSVKRFGRLQQAGQFRGDVWQCGCLKVRWKASAVEPSHQLALIQRKIEGMPIMVYEQHDFARNPIVEDQEFSLESKCSRCGSSVVARSLEELLQEEKRHRALCKLMRAA